ncbi:hypothetical protein [Halomonas sp. 328]|uniref:hypothetical protein n=1 Tax=Halomonas sp. 328 TaxID=2776704 RepID=UPI001E5B504E|nr:hypothetical protein [Halomonas sp. 328]
MPIIIDPMPASTTSLRLNALILATLLILGAASWYAAHRLAISDGIDWQAADAPCDLGQGPCHATLADGSQLRFAIDGERPIRALAPLTLRVESDANDIRQVRVDFEGIGMEMGLHRFPLAPAGEGQFVGPAQVAICTEAVMPWRARVRVETEAGWQGAWFDFTAVRSF